MDALKKNGRGGCNLVTNYAYIPQRNRMQAIPPARQTYLHVSCIIVFDYCHSTQYYTLSFIDLFPKIKSAKSYDTHTETAFLF